MVTSKIFTRDFVLSFSAQFAFSSVFCILIPTLPIYLSRLKSTEAEIGILIGIFSLSSLVFRPFVGRALLRIPEKKFMLVGSLVYAFSCFAYLWARPFWPFSMVRIIQGVGLALFATASFTMIARIFPETHRSRMISYYYLSVNLAFILGPYFGIVLINLFDFTFLFLTCTGLSLCSLFITARLNERPDLSKNQLPEDQSLLSREALPPAIIAFMVNVVWGAVAAFFPLYALSHGVSNPGSFFGVFAMTLILVRSLGGKLLDIYSKDQVIPPCLCAQILAMIILAFSTTLPWFVLVGVIWGIGMAFLYPTLVAYSLDHAGSSLGPAMGTFTAVADFGTAMGPVIMGIILQFTNYQIMFLSLGLTSLLNLGYFQFIVHKRSVKRHANLRIPM
jgi:MFS family permease